MSKLIPTYVRENGTVYAFFESRVIAEGKDFKKVEESAVDYLDHLGKDRKDKDQEDERQKATHITTPNGLRGEILGRVQGQWGDKELTVRFENGRIAKFTAHSEDQVQYSNERVASTAANPIEALQEELDESFAHDKSSLIKRIASLDKIVVDATGIFSRTASYSEERDINKIVLVAENEKRELSDALEYLKQADAETFQPEAPYSTTAVEQAELGHASDNSWLDHTVQEMITESAGQNFDKILSEEPALLAAGLESGTLADQGSTAEVSLAHITAKTAAFQGDEVESYREKFVAATEQARRAELALRQQENHKQAATKEEESADFPDDALFMR